MAETAMRDGTETNRRIRTRLPGKRIGLCGGLVFLLAGLAMVYMFGVGQPGKRSATETAEASPMVPMPSRLAPHDSPSARPPVVSGTNAPSDSKASPTAKTSAKLAASTPALSGAVRDEAYRRLLVGKWETERSGLRELTVRPDGTATMVVQLTGLNAVLFGKKLTFWIKWTVQNGKLAFSTTGGEPASRIQVITVMYGTNRVQQIRSLTEDRLLLIDEEGDPDHDYRRIAAKTK